MYYSLKLKQIPIISNFFIQHHSNENPPDLADQAHILLIVVDGKIKIHMEGKVYILKKSDVFFIPSGYLYRPEFSDESLCIIHIHFIISDTLQQMDYNELTKNIMDEYNRMDKLVLIHNEDFPSANTIYLQNKNVIKNQVQLNSILNKITTYTRVRSIMYNMQLSSLLVEILVSISQQTLDSMNLYQRLEFTPKSCKKLNKSIEYIHKNFHTKITLTDLCEHCNISKSQMIRLFRKNLNTTPSQYIINYKLARAREFIFRNPEMTINEVSTALGYENQHYFSKQFSKKYNESPSHYRNKKLMPNRSQQQML